MPWTAAWAVALALLAAPVPAAAQDQRPAGDFDYWVLALSWNASFCEAEGDRADAPQCDPSYDIGFGVHGLWPQYEVGWPQDCRSDARDPSRRQTAAEADLFGSGGYAWHQWRKHGRCSGLRFADYVALTREAYARVARPAILRQLEERVRIDPLVVEAAFLEANPAMEPRGVTVTCRDGLLREVRVCLTRSLEPRACGRDVVRDCRAGAVELPPMR